jgi:hypothetical protein
MVALAAVLAPWIPRLEPREKVRYGRLLLAVLRTITGNRTVQVTMLIGATWSWGNRLRSRFFTLVQYP